MRILIAPDKFKGSLSAADVADNLAKGLARVDVDSASLPLADGGDGSVAAAVAAGLQAHVRDVSGPTGRRRTATIAVNGSTAVVEIANTCGLAALNPGDLAPMTASSYGFGEAIRHAVDLGARRLVLALGGSASTDGGTGMLAALGYRFHDINGDEVAATTRTTPTPTPPTTTDALHGYSNSSARASDNDSRLNPLCPNGVASPPRRAPTGAWCLEQAWMGTPRPGNGVAEAEEFAASVISLAEIYSGGTLRSSRKR